MVTMVKKSLALNVECKACWWYRALISVFKLLVFTGLADSDTAIEKLCGLVDRGFKIKIGSGKWERFRSRA